jgi:hypothetical protein
MLSKARTHLTKWLSACALTQVFSFDVVAEMAIGVVVVDVRIDRVPRSMTCHDDLFNFGLISTVEPMG